MILKLTNNCMMSNSIKSFISENLKENINRKIIVFFQRKYYFFKGLTSFRNLSPK